MLFVCAREPTHHDRRPKARARDTAVLIEFRPLIVYTAVSHENAYTKRDGNVIMVSQL